MEDTLSSKVITPTLAGAWTSLSADISLRWLEVDAVWNERAGDSQASSCPSCDFKDTRAMCILVKNSKGIA